MKQSAWMQGLGPLCTLYAAIVLFSSGQPITLSTWLFVVGAGIFSAIPFLLRFRMNTQVRSHVVLLSFGIVLLWLGLSVFHSDSTFFLFAKVLGPVLFGISIIEITLSFSHVNKTAWSFNMIQMVVWIVGGVAAILALGSLLPPIEWADEYWIFPFRFRFIPWFFLFVLLAISTLMHLVFQLRRSEPEKKASSVWALLPLILSMFGGVFIFVLLWNGQIEYAQPIVQFALCLLSLLLLFGHLGSLDTQKRLEVGAFFRSSVAVIVTSWLGLSLMYVFDPTLLSDSMIFSVKIWGVILICLALRPWIQKVFDPLLAPDGGKLLSAVKRTDVWSASTTTFNDFVGALLKPFRAIQKGAGSDPKLFLINPDKEVTLDAAGNVHINAYSIPRVILEHLEEYPRKMIVYSFLEHLRVRRPDLRPLIDCLEQMKVFCVIPFYAEEHLEGVLLLPRGKRKKYPTLEELTALYQFSNTIAGFVSLHNSYSRIEKHLNQQIRENQKLLDRLDRIQESYQETTGAFQDTDIQLRDGLDMCFIEPFRSELMQTLRDRLVLLAQTDVPILFCGDLGTHFSSLIDFVHQNSPYADFPFFVVDCSDANENFSSKEGQQPEKENWLGRLRQLPENFCGTIVFYHAGRLNTDEQQQLSHRILEFKKRYTSNSLEPFCPFRCVLTSNLPYQALQKNPDSFFQSLQSTSFNVPRLAERKQDLPELIDSSFSRVCLQLGENKSLEEAAREKLIHHPWLVNHVELYATLAMAMIRSDSSQIVKAEHVVFFNQSDSSIADAENKTYFELENEILMNALEKAQGNKSQAARLLGLKRSTFVDKLKKSQSLEVRRDLN